MAFERIEELEKVIAEVALTVEPIPRISLYRLCKQALDSH